MSTSNHPIYTVHVPKYWLVHEESSELVYSRKDGEEPDHSSLLFHVTSGDYLATLATILRFFEETIHDQKTEPGMRDIQLKTIERIRNDLLYLNKNYVIAPKDEKPKN